MVAEIDGVDAVAAVDGVISTAGHDQVVAVVAQLDVVVVGAEHDGIGGTARGEQRGDLEGLEGAVTVGIEGQGIEGCRQMILDGDGEGAGVGRVLDGEGQIARRRIEGAAGDDPTRSHLQTVEAAAGNDGVVAAGEQIDVVAAATEQVVIAAASVDGVVAAGPEDVVVAAAAEDGLVGGAPGKAGVVGESRAVQRRGQVERDLRRSVEDVESGEGIVGLIGDGDGMGECTAVLGQREDKVAGGVDGGVLDLEVRPDLQGVAAAPDNDNVVAARGLEQIIPNAADEGIVTAETVEDVVAGATFQTVVDIAAGQGVVEGGADDVLDIGDGAGTLGGESENHIGRLVGFVVGHDQDVGKAVAVDVAGGADRVAGVIGGEDDAVGTVHGRDVNTASRRTVGRVLGRQVFAAEEDVGGAVVAFAGVGAGCADQNVVDAIAVEVAGRAYGPAGVVPGEDEAVGAVEIFQVDDAVDIGVIGVESGQVTAAEHQIGGAGQTAGPFIGRHRARGDDQVVEAVAVDVAG